MRAQFLDRMDLDRERGITIRAQTGEGVPAVLDRVVERVPAPKGDPDAALRALIFDSHYDTYRGVVLNIRVVDGTLTKGDRFKLMAAGAVHDADEIGLFTPDMT